MDIKKIFYWINKTEIKEEDIKRICKTIEVYLSSSLKGLETYSSIYLNTDKISKYLLCPNLFFSIVSREFIPNKNEINLDEIYEVYAYPKESKTPILLTTYIVSKIIISSNYLQVTYNTHKNITFPNIKLSFSIRELENKKYLFSINIKPNEQTIYELNNNVYKFWKKRAYEFYHFLEKNNSKKV